MNASTKAAHTSELTRWPMRLSVISPLFVISARAIAVSPGRPILLSARLRSYSVVLCESGAESFSIALSERLQLERLSAVSFVFACSASASDWPSATDFALKTTEPPSSSDCVRLSFSARLH